MCVSHAICVSLCTLLYMAYFIVVPFSASREYRTQTSTASPIYKLSFDTKNSCVPCLQPIQAVLIKQLKISTSNYFLLPFFIMHEGSDNLLSSLLAFSMTLLYPGTLTKLCNASAFGSAETKASSRSRAYTLSSLAELLRHCR